MVVTALGMCNIEILTFVLSPVTCVVGPTTALKQLLSQVNKRFSDLSLLDFPCRIPRFRHHRGEGGGGYAKYYGSHLHLSSFVA
jgi:hypothetical protein